MSGARAAQPGADASAPAPGAWPLALPHADRALIAAVRDALAEAADPSKAGEMQRYMKSALPFFGVQKPARAAIARALLPAHPLDGCDAWHDTALALWREATRREERYLALALIRHRRYRAHRTLAALPLYDELVVTGAWWDLVDEVAAHLLGGLLLSDRDATARVLRAWARDPDLWRRRAALVAQVNHKAKTDWPLLRDCVVPNLGDPDVFMRKGIGWALSSYAEVDPAAVVAFCDEHAAALSPLSRREALRKLARG